MKLLGLKCLLAEGFPVLSISGGCPWPYIIDKTIVWFMLTRLLIDIITYVELCICTASHICTSLQSWMILYWLFLIIGIQFNSTWFNREKKKQCNWRNPETSNKYCSSKRGIKSCNFCLRIIKILWKTMSSCNSYFLNYICGKLHWRWPLKILFLHCQSFPHFYNVTVFCLLLFCHHNSLSCPVLEECSYCLLFVTAFSVVLVHWCPLCYCRGYSNNVPLKTKRLWLCFYRQKLYNRETHLGLEKRSLQNLMGDGSELEGRAGRISGTPQQESGHSREVTYLGVAEPVDGGTGIRTKVVYTECRSVSLTSISCCLGRAQECSTWWPASWPLLWPGSAWMFGSRGNTCPFLSTPGRMKSVAW